MSEIDLADEYTEGLESEDDVAQEELEDDMSQEESEDPSIEDKEIDENVLERPEKIEVSLYPLSEIIKGKDLKTQQAGKRSSEQAKDAAE